MSFGLDWFLGFGFFMAAIGFVIGAYINDIENLIGSNTTGCP